MIRRPPRSTRTDTLFPYTPLFRSLFDDPESALLRLHVTGETLISDIVKPALLSLRMPQFDDTALVGARWGRCARQRCIRFQKSAFRLYSLRVTCLPCLSERIGPRCIKSFTPHFIGGRDHLAPIRDGLRWDTLRVGRNAPLTTGHDRDGREHTP